MSEIAFYRRSKDVIKNAKAAGESELAPKLKPNSEILNPPINISHRIYISLSSFFKLSSFVNVI